MFVSFRIILVFVLKKDYGDHRPFIFVLGLFTNNVEFFDNNNSILVLSCLIGFISPSHLLIRCFFSEGTS